GCKRDRGRIRQRKPRERREVGEHAANTEKTTAKLPERPARAYRGRELAADGIDKHDRQDRESAAEKHHLPDRRDVTELAHQSRHGGKKQSGNQFQADGLEWVHHKLNDSPIHTGAAPPCHRCLFPPAVSAMEKSKRMIHMRQAVTSSIDETIAKASPGLRNVNPQQNCRLWMIHWHPAAP